MFDSAEMKPVLSHHVTWVHNAPKCNSCSVMNGRGRGGNANDPSTLGKSCPDGRLFSETQSSTGIVRRSLPADEMRSGECPLPEIIQGKSIRRRHRYAISNTGASNGQAAGNEMISLQDESINCLPRLPQVSRLEASQLIGKPVGLNRYQQRLSKSLDFDQQKRKESMISLPSVTTSRSNSLQVTTGSTRIVSDVSVSDSGVFDLTNDEERLLSRVSLDDESGSDGEVDASGLIIHPFPYQSERSPYGTGIDIARVRPPTPIKKKKNRRKKKVVPPPPPKPRPKKAKIAYQRKKPINLAALRRHEQEVARQLPVKKQFLYSSILEHELQSFIPARAPGGRLKAVYKRSQTGEIFVPDYPITVKYTQLISENDHAQSNSPWLVSRRQEALQAFLERRRKTHKHMASKTKQKHVRFTLPSDHVDTASERESDQDGLVQIEGNDTARSPSASPNGSDKVVCEENNLDWNVDELQTGQARENTTEGEDTGPDGQQDTSVVSAISEESLRDLEGAPPRKRSDVLVHEWLQSTEQSRLDHQPFQDKLRTCITDQVVKLPKIVEAEQTQKISFSFMAKSPINDT